MVAGRGQNVRSNGSVSMSYRRASGCRLLPDLPDAHIERLGRALPCDKADQSFVPQLSGLPLHGNSKMRHCSQMLASQLTLRS